MRSVFRLGLAVCSFVCVYLLVVACYGRMLAQETTEKVLRASKLSFKGGGYVKDIPFTQDIRLQIVQSIRSYKSFSYLGKKSVCLGDLAFEDEGGNEVLNVVLLKDMLIQIDGKQFELREDLLEVCAIKP